MPSAAKTILVTGGAGYIGACLTGQLLSDGHSVRVLDSMLYGNGALAPVAAHTALTIIRGDVRHGETVRLALEGVDAVVHLAAIVGDPACALDPETTIDINHRATVDLAALASAAGIERFVFASTCSVYGAGSADLDEDAAVNPVSLYAETKIAAERELLAWTTDQFRPTILRFATLSGLAPRLRFDLVANLLVGRAVAGLAIEIHGGAQWRPFLHVQDAASAIRHALGLEPVHAAATFNVGSSAENYRLAELGRIVAELVPGTQLTIDDAAIDQRTYHVRFDRFAETGFIPKRTLIDGLSELRDYLRARPDVRFDDPSWSNERWLKLLDRT